MRERTTAEQIEQIEAIQRREYAKDLQYFREHPTAPWRIRKLARGELPPPDVWLRTHRFVALSPRGGGRLYGECFWHWGPLGKAERREIGEAEARTMAAWWAREQASQASMAGADNYDDNADGDDEDEEERPMTNG